MKKKNNKNVDINNSRITLRKERSLKGRVFKTISTFSNNCPIWYVITRELTIILASFLVPLIGTILLDKQGIIFICKNDVVEILNPTVFIVCFLSMMIIYDLFFVFCYDFIIEAITFKISLWIMRIITILITFGILVDQFIHFFFKHYYTKWIFTEIDKHIFPWLSIVLCLIYLLFIFSKFHKDDNYND